MRYLHKYRSWGIIFCCPKEARQPSLRRPPGHESHQGEDLLPPSSVSGLSSVWEENLDVDQEPKYASQWHLVPSHTVVFLGSLSYSQLFSWASWKSHRKENVSDHGFYYTGIFQRTWCFLLIQVESWAHAFFGGVLCKPIITLCFAKDECSDPLKGICLGVWYSHHPSIFTSRWCGCLLVSPHWSHD